MSSTLDQLKLLAKANIYEFLKNIKDPKRELLARMDTLKKELDDGRRELAQQGASVGDYEAAETALEEQIAFEQNQAGKCVDNKNDDGAREHLRKVATLQAQREEAKKSTGDFKTSLADLETTVDAVAQQLSDLEKVYSQIEIKTTKGDQLHVLNEIVKAREGAKELDDAAQREVFKQQALAEMNGTELPAGPADDEIEKKLEQLKQKGQQ